MSNLNTSISITPAINQAEFWKNFQNKLIKDKSVSYFWLGSVAAVWFIIVTLFINQNLMSFSNENNLYQLLAIETGFDNHLYLLTP